MKDLFNKDERYTTNGIDLDSEVSKVLRPLYKSWSEKGFSLRDISHIIISEAVSLECDFILRKAVRITKRKE